jgi:HAE1 family hydrophobic/amphiphilic exporter-1
MNFRGRASPWSNWTVHLIASAAVASVQPATAQAPAAAPSFAAAPTDAADATREPLRLSLEDALRLSLQRNLDLAIDAANLEVSRARSVGSWGAFDPTYSLRVGLRDAEQEAPSSLTGAEVLEENTQSLQASLGLPLQTGGRFDVSFDTENSKTNSQFSLADTSTTDVVRLAYTQPLWRGAWRGYATSEQRLAQLALQQAEQRRLKLRADIELAVRRAYWDLVGALRQLEVRELAVALAREQVQQNERRLEVGVGTEVDVLQANTTLAQRAELLLLGKSNVKAADDALKALVLSRTSGAPWSAELDEWDTPIEPTTALYDPLEYAIPQVGRVLAEALQARAELVEQRLTIESAELRLSRASSELHPSLEAGLSATAIGFDGDPAEAFDKSIGFDFPALEASLTLSGPLRNRSARGNARAARAEVRAALLTYDKSELQILIEVRAALRELEYQAEAVAAADKSSDLARRQLEAEQARYAQGLSTTFQLLDFQQQLAVTLGSQTAALASYARARSQLDRAIGRSLGGGP